MSRRERESTAPGFEPRRGVYEVDSSQCSAKPYPDSDRQAIVLRHNRARVADALATALATLPDRFTRRAISTRTALGVAVVDRLEAVRVIRAQARPTGFEEVSSG